MPTAREFGRRYVRLLTWGVPVAVLTSTVVTLVMWLIFGSDNQSLAHYAAATWLPTSAGTAAGVAVLGLLYAARD